MAFRLSYEGFTKMFLLVHRLIRGAVLAGMVLLATTAFCSCDSYDPDPYDDVPPIVTVDFNYVVPAGVSVRRPQSQGKRQLALYSGNKTRQFPSPDAPGLRAWRVNSSLLPGAPQWAIPLRR
jgi:hypothetical protein